MRVGVGVFFGGYLFSFCEVGEWGSRGIWLVRGYLFFVW